MSAELVESISKEMDFFSYPEHVFEKYCGSCFELPQLNIATKSHSLAKNFLITLLLSVLFIVFIILITFVATVGSFGALVVLVRYILFLFKFPFLASFVHKKIFDCI